MTKDFHQLLIADLSARGVEFDAEEDGFYLIHTKAGALRVNTENIRSEFARDKDPGMVSRFVASVLSVDTQPLKWPDARQRLFPMIESIKVEIGTDTVVKPLTDQTRIVLALHNPETNSVRFVSKSDLHDWGVSDDGGWNAAYAAFGQIVANTKIELLEAGDIVLGVIQIHEPFKASMILSDQLKQHLPSELGWPVFAVVPARDFVYLLRKKDESQLGRLGAIVVSEYKQSGYPVSTEVWELSDAGPKAIGEFPVK